MLQDSPQSHSSSSSSKSSGESFEGIGAAENDDDIIQIFNLPPHVSHQSIVNEAEHFGVHRQPRPTFYNTNPNRRPPYPSTFSYPSNPTYNSPFYPQTPYNEFPNPIYNTELQDDDDSFSPSDINGNGEGPSEIADLTNDIRVNQILSENGRPFNPDAEFISVPNQPRPRPFESYPQQYPTYYFTAFRDIKK